MCQMMELNGYVSLRKLQINPYIVFESGSLGKLILLCPYVTQLCLRVVRVGIKNSDLLSIIALKTSVSLIFFTM